MAFVSRASNHEDAHAVSVLREVADETGALRGVLDAWCGTPERATRTRIAARNAAAHYAWSACASAADVVYRAVTGDRA